MTLDKKRHCYYNKDLAKKMLDKLESKLYYNSNEAWLNASMLL